MPLTKQQLLIPRVLCIGTEDGKQNYPKSLFKSGQVIELDNISHDGRYCYVVPSYDIDYFLSYPNCFNPLPWWYGRTVEEMPRYVNTNSVYGIRKVKEWAFIKGEKLDRWRVEDTRGEIYSTFHLDITPADESEYQEYQKQKQ